MLTMSAVALAVFLSQIPSSPPETLPPPEARQLLTLDQALEIAAARNLDLAILKAKLDQASELSWKAWSRYLPQVTATGAWQRQKESFLSLPAVNPAPPPDLVTVTVPLQAKEVWQGQLEVTQTILSPELLFGIRAAMKESESAALSYGDGRRALFFGVASAYYAAASAKQAVEVSERLLEIARRQEEDARVRFQAGAVARVALLRAEIDRARAEQDLSLSRNAFESARISLATLLDRPVDFDVVEPPAPPLPDGAEADKLVQAALRDRLDVRAARVGVDAARAGRSSAAARYLPSVAAFAREQRQDRSGLGGDSSWQAGVQLQWQILDGGLRESDLREGNAKVAEALATERSAEARAREEVLQALLDLDSARANGSKASEQRELAAENLRLVGVSYKAGAATAVELADATAVLRTAELNVTTQTLAVRLAALRVLQAAGELRPDGRR